MENENKIEKVTTELLPVTFDVARDALAKAAREKEEAEQAAKQAVIDLQREEERRADEDRRAEEKKKLDAERAELAAQQKKIDDEKERQRFEAVAKKVEEKRIANEKANVETQRNNRDEMILGLTKLSVTSNSEDVIADAIIAGKIPHVKYTG